MILRTWLIRFKNILSVAECQQTDTGEMVHYYILILLINFIHKFYKKFIFCILISNALFIDSGRKMNTFAATSQAQHIQETVKKRFRIPILAANSGVAIQRHAGYPIVAVGPTSMKRFVISNVAIPCKMT